MSEQQSKPKNRKPQVIDLTNETFEFSEHGFSIEGFTDKEGKRWFSAEIACQHLEHSNVSKAVSTLPYRDKATIITKGYNGVPVRHLMVSQAGLYRLIFKSRTNKAEQYQDWVFDDVLPQIQARGGYISPDATPKQLEALQSQLNIARLQIARLERKTADQDQVMYWLGKKQGAGRFLEDTLPNGDRD